MLDDNENRAVVFDYVVNHRVRQYLTVQVRGVVVHDKAAPNGVTGFQLSTSKYVSLRYFSDSLPASNTASITSAAIARTPARKGDGSNGSSGMRGCEDFVYWEWDGAGSARNGDGGVSDHGGGSTWITLPIKYSELTPTSTIAFTVHNLDGTVFGGTSLRVFNEKGLLGEGNQKLRLHLGREGDGSVQSRTPGQHRQPAPGPDDVSTTEGFVVDDYTNAMVKSLESYRRGKVPKLPWLDSIVLPLVEEACASNGCVPESVTPGGGNVLFVGMPYFQAPLVFEEMKYFSKDSMSKASVGYKVALEQIEQNRQASKKYAQKDDFQWKDSLAWVVDPELVRAPVAGVSQSPAEVKHHRLARGNLVRGMFGVVKPNKGDKEIIKKIIYKTDLSISREEREILWKFRYSLVEEKRSLIKFLMSVNWNDSEEVRVVTLELMPKWKRIDLADALMLLSHQFANNMPVRKHAIGILDDAPDEEVELFMLQLVQAMRYEPLPPREGWGEARDSPAPSTRKRTGDAAGDALEREVLDVLDGMGVLDSGDESGGGGGGGSSKAQKGEVAASDLNDCLLSTFLIDRAIESFPLAASLYWFLSVEQVGDPKFKAVFKALIRRLEDSVWGQEVLEKLGRQRWWLEYVARTKKAATAKGGGKPAMLERLKASMRSDGAFAEMLAMDPPVISPLDTSTSLVGVKPDNTLMFTSKIYPVVLQFQAEQSAGHPQSPGRDHEEYKRLATAEGRARRARRASQLFSSTNALPDSGGRETRGRHSRRNSNSGLFPKRDESDAPSKSLSSGSMEGGEGGAGRRSGEPPGGRRRSSLSMGSEGGGDDDDANARTFAALGGRGSPSLSATGLMSQTRSKLDNFFQSRTSLRIMYKAENLKQDQVVVQMITLIDRLWKSVNLDLKLTPYNVLATSPDDGLVAFIPETTTLTDVFGEYNRDIRAFFRAAGAKKGNAGAPGAAVGEEGLDPDVMDTFIRSCAGYCVITYILGIGDRHLENIMVKPTGHLLHIDFGFLFGHDPKPFMGNTIRLTKEMVDAMGGPRSEGYEHFKRYCCQGYNIIRRQAPLLLSLLELLRDAGINDFSVWQDADKAIDGVKEKLQLHLEDEAIAEEFLLKKLHENLKSLFPGVVDFFHNIAMSLKD
jgi:hypothetical protein